jgi:hypothetical protein
MWVQSENQYAKCQVANVEHELLGHQLWYSLAFALFLQYEQWLNWPGN